jgi:CheY-like chemotaxis protein
VRAIAHDLNNLLTAIVGCGDLALRDLPRGHAARARVEQLQVEAGRAALLVRELLAAAPEPAGSRTVLLVEDDPGMREMTCEILAEAGFEVVAASSGAEAIATAEGRAVDLLLTDLMMPGMSGPELVERLCARRPEMKVVFMSGYSAASAPSGVAADAEFLEKPFAGSTLVAAVRKALARPPA